MTKKYVEFIFELQNGSTHKVTINDVREDVEDSKLNALANALIEKDSHYNGSAFTRLKKCSKFTLEEEII